MPLPQLGREEPAVSMDSSGKIVWARHNEIQTANANVRLGPGTGAALCRLCAYFLPPLTH